MTDLNNNKIRFCSQCGTKLDERARFCKGCGKAIEQVQQPKQEQSDYNNIENEIPNYESNTQRKTVYDGEIHKCPNCGESLNSFVLNCPTCNYEIRSSKATVSIQQFYLDLNRTKSTEEKTLMIRNYPIPNAKEDIVEFMILASSNISGETDKNIFDAWIAKFEQAYQKAQISLQGDTVFTQIEDIYEKTQKVISKGKILHTTNIAGNFISRFFKSMPNPFVALLVIWIGFCIISAIVRKSYIFIIIAAIAFIAYLIYKNYKSNKNDKS